ncbi:MAG: protein kinase [candidate division Zixibacteria bacterium]|nr:protein kinase [candidate division Zixibacteria bacterium]
MLGKQIQHYSILEKLGAGGMGEVYLAEDTTLKRRVALKLLAPSYSNDPEFVARFRHEAQAAAALDHPNIVTVYELGEHESQLFITMQYVRGQTLQNLIESGKLTLKQSLNIAQQICEGLSEAHQAGIVHRDIKPANILYTKDSVAKILDFGLAKISGATKLTKEGSTLGTVQYQSPEQCRGEEADQRSDLFSLGVVLYEMITGKLPFTGDYEVSVRYAISHEEAHPLSRFTSRIPDDLQRIVTKLLEKDPALRYQNAESVLSDFRKLAISGVRGPLARESKKSRLRALVAGLTVITALVATSIWYFSEDDNTETSIDNPKKLVVLPFKTTGDAEREYFASSVSDEIRTRITEVRGLSVISRLTSESYKFKTRSVRSIAKELAVDFAVDGSVVLTRDSNGDFRVSIIAELIDVSDDRTVWSGSYDTSLSEIFYVGSDIAAKVVHHVVTDFSVNAELTTRTSWTDNTDAYDYYLRGNQYLERQAGYPEIEDYMAALELYEKAIQLDSSFVPAFAQVAKTYVGLSRFMFSPIDSPCVNAERFATLAMSLDSSATPTKEALGEYYAACLGDWEKARLVWAQAHDNNLNTSEYFSLLARYQRQFGRREEAYESQWRAWEKEPTSQIMRLRLATDCLWLRKYDEAEELANELLDTEPDLFFGHLMKVEIALLRDGDVSAARQIMFASSGTVGADDWIFFAVPMQLDIFEGNFEQALDMADQLSFTSRSWYKGLIYYSMGEMSQMLDAFDSAIVEIDSGEAGPPSALTLAMKSVAYAALGRRNEALRSGELAVARQPFMSDRLDLRWQLAMTYNFLGMSDQAVSTLDTLLQIPTIFSRQTLRLDPVFSTLRNHPRFQSLVDKYSENGPATH